MYHRPLVLESPRVPSSHSFHKTPALSVNHASCGPLFPKTLHKVAPTQRFGVARISLENTGRLGSRLGQTALYMASSLIHGYADVLRSLIDRGVDLNSKCQNWEAIYCGVMWTPLRVAIDKEHRDIVLPLLEGGADTETRSDRDETALYVASSLGHDDIVRQLISRGAHLNAECQALDRCGNDVKWCSEVVGLACENASWLGSFKEIENE